MDSGSVKKEKKKERNQQLSPIAISKLNCEDVSCGFIFQSSFFDDLLIKD